ncbi:MAG: glycosyltransferase [Chitinophagaceae bacterium]|nr:MAG: glycosyltransferase [Chitinophagaceae bacterium]
MFICDNRQPSATVFITIMRILSSGYHATLSYSDPTAWLQRIDFYTGILEALATKHEVHSIEHINARTSLQQTGVHYHFRPLPSQRFPWSGHRFIRSLRPDLVLINGVSFPLQVLQLRAALGQGPRILLWHRDEKPAPGWRGRLQAMAGRAVDGYLFTSPGNVAAWVARGIIPASKVHYLLHGSSVFLPGDRTEARQMLGVPIDAPLFLWVGRLDANKDPLTVLRAFSALLEEAPRAKLAMAFGGGPLEAELRAFVAGDPKLSGAVQLLGTLPHRDLEPWYRAAGFFVSASHYEGGGIAFCEALSCGCIPVYTRIPSLQQLAGPCGVSFPPGDAAALQQAFRQALRLDAAAQRTEVLQRFQEHFSFTAIARGLLHIVEDSVSVPSANKAIH